jgi:hypothetical protein
MTSESGMRVLIQDCSTKLFLRNAKAVDWCDSADKAKNFGSSVTAINHAVDQRLPDCEVILKFGNPKYDIHFTVSAMPHAQRQ